MTRFKIFQARDGRWLAYATVDGTDADVTGRGDSSVEAHCDLLEKLDQARILAKQP